LVQTLIDHFDSTLKISLYQFGIEAEYVVGIYLKSKGWSLEISRCSKGPADIIAIRHSNKWLIQVKSSALISRVKRYEVRRLIDSRFHSYGSYDTMIIHSSPVTAGLIDCSTLVLVT
jgi:hypothetical protein